MSQAEAQNTYRASPQGISPRNSCIRTRSRYTQWSHSVQEGHTGWRACPKAALSGHGGLAAQTKRNRARVGELATTRSAYAERRANLALRECARQAHAFRGDGQHSLANVMDGEQGTARTLGDQPGFPGGRLRYSVMDARFRVGSTRPSSSSTLREREKICVSYKLHRRKNAICHNPLLSKERRKLRLA